VILQLKKVADGRPTLACLRADGSRTWAKLHPFFPEHDLTHCAVESALGITNAFFGLVASGWDLDTFADRGARTRLPVEALWAESIVGILLAEVKRRLQEHRLDVSLDAAAIDLLVEKGFDPRMGARPLRRAIQRLIEDPLSELVLAGKFPPGSMIRIGRKGDELTFDLKAESDERESQDERVKSGA